MSGTAPELSSTSAAFATVQPQKTKPKRPVSSPWKDADIETLMSMRAKLASYDDIRHKLRPVRSNLACRLMVMQCISPKARAYKRFWRVIDPYFDAVKKISEKTSDSKTAGKQKQKQEPNCAQNQTTDTDTNANTDTNINTNTHMNGTIPEYRTVTQPGFSPRAAAIPLSEPLEEDKTEEDIQTEDESDDEGLEPASPVEPHRSLTEVIADIQQWQRDFTYQGHVPGLSIFLQREFAGKGKTYQQCVNEYMNHIARVETTRPLTSQERWGLYAGRVALQAADVHATAMQEDA
ncbi:hypothetical protein CERZMDRAFT_80155 [Cercospora zeae-maydis SCOH1-5]|uniref:Uncharacterized protein n=1 Tax=Cercospora zeae-maydis SCOH1-5 TaxID=717836 RepID=A0A6A6FVV9_9PEZI|nr:hypothetical protein CERZMDRAFT_80155 [Cercospora zeae-maydis SCOH1-5]